MTMTIDDLFAPFITAADEPSADTERAKAEVRDFIRRHENLHLLYDPAFLRAAVANAGVFAIPSDAEDDDDDRICPHCGQSTHKW